MAWMSACSGSLENSPALLPPFEEIHARHHRIAVQRVEGELEGRLTGPWMTRRCWLDVRVAGVGNHKCNPFGVNVPLIRWCGVRPCCVRGSPWGFERACHVLLERRRRSISCTATPRPLLRLIHELLRRCRVTQGIARDGGGKRAAPACEKARRWSSPLAATTSIEDMISPMLQMQNTGSVERLDSDERRAEIVAHPKRGTTRRVVDVHTTDVRCLRADTRPSHPCWCSPVPRGRCSCHRPRVLHRRESRRRRWSTIATGHSETSRFWCRTSILLPRNSTSTGGPARPCDPDGGLHRVSGLQTA